MGSAQVTIWHNPACGTSRNVLALIRNAGIEPEIIEYLRSPLDRTGLLAAVARMAVPLRGIVRSKEAIYTELDLAGADDEALLEAMLAHPVLINRPIVFTGGTARLCRPSEVVLDILPLPQRAAFNKEDGEPVVGADLRRIGG